MMMMMIMISKLFNRNEKPHCASWVKEILKESTGSIKKNGSEAPVEVNPGVTHV